MSTVCHDAVLTLRPIFGWELATLLIMVRPKLSGEHFLVQQMWNKC